MQGYSQFLYSQNLLEMFEMEQTLHSLVTSSTGRILLQNLNLKCQRGPTWSPIILQCGHFPDLVTFKGKRKGEKKDKGDGLTEEISNQRCKQACLHILRVVTLSESAFYGDIIYRSNESSFSFLTLKRHRGRIRSPLILQCGFSLTL